jgi:hypothetical protein
MSSYTTAHRREAAATLSKYKPGQTVQYSNPGVQIAEVKIEYVDLVFVKANGEYTLTDFNENAFEYSVMILGKSGFAHTRIRARTEELTPL